MNREVLTVKLEIDGEVVSGKLIVGEIAMQEAGELCTLSLSCQVGEFNANGPDYFEALVRLRRQLEAMDMQIMLNGASFDVWPSAMARSMGLGLQAYRMRLGKQARQADLVPILELHPESRPCSIAEQERYRDQWFKSLGSAA